MRRYQGSWPLPVTGNPGSIPGRSHQHGGVVQRPELRTPNPATRVRVPPPPPAEDLRGGQKGSGSLQVRVLRAFQTAREERRRLVHRGQRRPPRRPRHLGHLKGVRELRPAAERLRGGGEGMCKRVIFLYRGTVRGLLEAVRKWMRCNSTREKERPWEKPSAVEESCPLIASLPYCIRKLSCKER